MKWVLRRRHRQSKEEACTIANYTGSVLVLLPYRAPGSRSLTVCCRTGGGVMCTRGGSGLAAWRRALLLSSSPVSPGGGGSM